MIISSDIIIEFFKKCCINYALDGFKDDSLREDLVVPKSESSDINKDEENESESGGEDEEFCNVI